MVVPESPEKGSRDPRSSEGVEEHLLDESSETPKELRRERPPLLPGGSKASNASGAGPKQRSTLGALLLRTLSGSFVVGAVVGGLFAGGHWWTAVVSLLAILSLGEFYGILRRRFHDSSGIGLHGGLGILAAAALEVPERVDLLILTLVALAVLTLEIFRRQLVGTSQAIFNLGGTLGGIIYVILPWSFLLDMRTEPWGQMVLFSLFLCTWSCDVLAYLVGLCWGRTPLCPAISPKKTWEGALGGLLGALGASGVVAYVMAAPPMPLLAIGLLCGTLGQLGDLAESALKREALVKDSGKILPGHGGILDRFDSLLFSAAVIYLLFGVVWS